MSAPSRPTQPICHCPPSGPPSPAPASITHYTLFQMSPHGQKGRYVIPISPTAAQTLLETSMISITYLQTFPRDDFDFVEKYVELLNQTGGDQGNGFSEYTLEGVGNVAEWGNFAVLLSRREVGRRV